MELIGMIGVMALVGMFFYSLKSYKHPCEEELQNIIKENREEAHRIIEQVKNKRKQ